MTVVKGYQYRIYPNKEQQVQIARTIGCARFVYNHYLDKWKQTYNATGKGLTYNKCAKDLTQFKKETAVSFLQEVDSTALQSSLNDLGEAYDRFFKKQNEMPKFKSKKRSRQSYTAVSNRNSIRIEGNRIRLPKLGTMRFANSRAIKEGGRILSATVRRNPSGKFFVSLSVEEPDAEPLQKTSTAAGADVGIRTFATLAVKAKGTTGFTKEAIANPRFNQKQAEKLSKAQRKLSKKAEIAKKQGKRLGDCANYQKQRRKVARLYEQATNQKMDFMHKTTTRLVKNHDILGLEDANIQGMAAGDNKVVRRELHNLSWAEFNRQLLYKAAWYGKEVVKVDRYYPSSQICSDCGHRDGAKDLSVTKWKCPACGTLHERDENASVNLLREALRIRKATPTTA